MKKPSSRNSRSSSPACASSRKDVRPAHLDHADLARAPAGRPLSGSVMRTSTPGSGSPTEPGNALAVIGVRGVHAGLGHAVAFEDRVAGALAEGAMRVGEQRRRAGDEEPHVGRRLARQAGLVEQPRVEGRHAHQHRRLRHPVEHFAGAELRQEDHARRPPSASRWSPRTGRACGRSAARGSARRPA